MGLTPVGVMTGGGAQIVFLDLVAVDAPRTAGAAAVKFGFVVGIRLIGCGL